MAIAAPAFCAPITYAVSLSGNNSDVTSPGSVNFASSGYAAGGSQPKLSIFAGSDTAATLFDYSDSDHDVDFEVMNSLAAGNYLIANFET